MKRWVAAGRCLGMVSICAALGLARHADAAEGASKCGAEPQAPSVKAGTVALYNDSVDRVTAYEKAARAYNSCVAAQANREETAISQDAAAKISRIHAGSAAVQTRIAASFQKLSADLAVASKKLGHH